MKRIKIGTRVYLNYIEFTKSKNDRLAVYFRDNLSGENASANAMLFPVLLSGSAKYPDMVAISEKLQSLYGANIMSTNVKRASEHVVGASVSFLNSRFTLEGEDNLSDCIKLMSEIILNPAVQNGAFREDYVETERTNLISDIRAEINNKGVYSINRCLEMMCDDDYKTGANGTEETAKKITAKSLYDNYLRLIGSAPIEVFYAGSETIERVVEMFKLYFTFPKGEAFEICRRTLLPKAQKVLSATETMDVSQAKLAMGFTTGIDSGSDLLQAISLFSAIYGVMPTSKLFMNVREKLSLCYSCGCRCYSVKGMLVVYAGIDAEKKEVAEAEILKQLDDMKAGDFTDEDIEIAKQSIISAVAVTNDSASELIDWWLTRICDGNMYSPEEAAEKYGAVTREDIVKAGEQITPAAVFFLTGKDREEQ